MKFQKDNSEVLFTQEMKAAIIERVEIRKQNIIDQQEEIAFKDAVAKELQEATSQLMAPVSDRIFAYGPISAQLDQLWHDIDDQKIQANTTAANTWYMNIKQAKESILIEENWRELMEDITANNV